MHRDSRDEEFSEFVAAHSDRLHRYGYVLTGSSVEAEELALETLVKVYLAWDRVRRDGSPLAYTTSAMARTHVSRWRSLTRRAPLEDRVALDRSRRTDRCWHTEAEDRDEGGGRLALLRSRPGPEG